MGDLELALSGRRTFARDRVLILPTSAFVEPPGLTCRAVNSWRPDCARQFLQSNVERVIRAEVSLFYWILCVSVTRDQRYELLQPGVADDSDFGLNADLRDVGLVDLPGVVNGCCCLTAVDYLKVSNASDSLAALWKVNEHDL